MYYDKIYQGVNCPLFHFEINVKIQKNRNMIEKYILLGEKLWVHLMWN